MCFVWIGRAKTWTTSLYAHFNSYQTRKSILMWHCHYMNWGISTIIFIRLRVLLFFSLGKYPQYIYIYISKVKLATIVEGNPKAPFSIATTPRCRGGRYSFPGLLYFTLDPYLIMLSVKPGGIRYHFLSLWYDSTWDWTQVSLAIGEHSNP